MKIVGRVKIKKLYRFNIDHKIESVAVTNLCVLQKVKEEPWGTLWRARGNVDFSGYVLRKAAKEEEILNLELHINNLKWMLARLKSTRKKNATT